MFVHQGGSQQGIVSQGTTLRSQGEVPGQSLVRRSLAFFQAGQQQERLIADSGSLAAGCPLEQRFGQRVVALPQCGLSGGQVDAGGKFVTHAFALQGGESPGRRSRLIVGQKQPAAAVLLFRGHVGGTGNPLGSQFLEQLPGCLRLGSSRMGQPDGTAELHCCGSVAELFETLGALQQCVHMVAAQGIAGGEAAVGGQGPLEVAVGKQGICGQFLHPAAAGGERCGAGGCFGIAERLGKALQIEEGFGFQPPGEIGQQRIAPLRIAQVGQGLLVAFQTQAGFPGHQASLPRRLGGLQCLQRFLVAVGTQVFRGARKLRVRYRGDGAVGPEHQHGGKEQEDQEKDGAEQSEKWTLVHGMVSSISRGYGQPPRRPGGYR
ncbi:protein of unknown function [Trichlorobacter ammonificans]|uniref:Uncharacterized protein n=1 Tax=Trichlorobacter ammonificans TaxID=2916410 RepID=A0ABM9DA34_9BACT|nr:protein of unknown function [Trichlorobacter ammonificans]